VTILHINSGNLYGGVETFLLTLARARRFAPDMQMAVALCFEGRIADDLRQAGVVPAMLGEVRLRRPDKVRRARQALRALLARRPFDVVVCHQAWPYAIFAPVVKSAGIPIVCWMHMPQDGRHWLDRLAARVEPDCYVCNSRFTASQLPPTAARVEVIYVPVESAFGSTAPIAAADNRARSHERVVIIQVSRMEAWKGQRVLIEALAQLRDDPTWECWQVGGAQRPAEARYLDTLRADAGRFGISDRIEFLGHRSDVPALLAASDIFCQPNIEGEAFGISFVEALYAGLPVATSDIGGAREIVDATCGVLVPPNDASALASVLSRLLRDREARERLGRGGPARARALCDPETQMRAIARVLGSIPSQRAFAN
jgi:glycosyltransferase involved in cell wall biosynthesis